MKKILTVIILLLFSTVLFATTTYKIETSKGTQEVIIPDGYTEKDVLLEVAKAYYELSYDFDEITEKVETLTKDVETYIQENQKLRSEYDQLDSDYKTLVEKLTKTSKPTIFKGLVGAGVGYYQTSIYPVLNLGAELFERFSLVSSLGFLNNYILVHVGINVTF